MQNIRELLKLRHQVNSSLRQFLRDHEYLEAETPTLSPNVIPESYLEIFETTLTSLGNSKAKNAYLLASPEAYLKRLLTMNSGNIYYLGRAYRNHEPMGENHNHEFSILEWYKINYSYLELMKEIEQMIAYVASSISSDIGIDFASPWEYLTIEEAYSRFAPGVKMEPENFEKTYVQYLEPNLGTRGKPTFLYDFPGWQSPLAKEKNGLAERFELYINSIELINGWTELTDWRTQEENLKNENLLRQKLGKEALPFDRGFIESLKAGMPKCAGAAMGVDRLIMVLGGLKNIQEVILFPTLELFD